LLDERQNRYSYDTVGAITRFGGDAVGLKTPRSHSESRRVASKLKAQA
jgi:hypothetical protein